MTYFVRKYRFFFDQVTTIWKLHNILRCRRG
jgi:hypothetical protein